MGKALQFLIYNTPQEDIKVNVVMRDETIWLTQKAMAELFGTKRPAITKHLGNIYKSGELSEKDFYAMVQNKFHFAITGQTAAEIIHTKADKGQNNMGLQTWKNAPDGRILKSDVTVAKNYLAEKEIRQLERAVTGYFDYIEDLVERENTFTMEAFAESINAFLTFRQYDVLNSKGKISKKQADRKAN